MTQRRAKQDFGITSHPTTTKRISHNGHQRKKGADEKEQPQRQQPSIISSAIIHRHHHHRQYFLLDTTQDTKRIKEEEDGMRNCTTKPCRRCRCEKIRIVARWLVVIMTMSMLLGRCQAFVAPVRHSQRVLLTSSISRLFSTLEEDTQGRRIRQRGGSDNAPSNKSNGWDDNDDWGAPPSTSKSNKRESDGDGWDASYTPKPRAARSSPSRGGGSNRGSERGSERSSYFRNDRDFASSPRRRESNTSPSRFGGGGSRGGRPSSFSSSDNNKFSKTSNRPSGTRAINMNGLEAAGFVHLYGLSSVLNALQANRRDLTTSQERGAWLDNEEDEEAEEEQQQQREPPKPQAQFRPYLFVQEQSTTTRRGQKASDAERVLALAEERNVPVVQVDKGILNTLSGNRPHQGFVLRCGKLYFESLSRIPRPDEDAAAPSIWLVLDEVVDPQNLGALLRSAYFLGQGKKMGVLVCAKNSAPPSPVVSAASAGALELATVYSTSNLPRTLNQAKEDGFRIIGASSSVPSTTADDEGAETMPLYDLQDLPVSTEEDDRPVLLVLGSEGYGLRSLVAKACTEFVRIPSGMDGSKSEDEQGVDSLNVSVTGGILLWQLLSGRK